MAVNHFDVCQESFVSLDLKIKCCVILCDLMISSVGVRATVPPMYGPRPGYGFGPPSGKPGEAVFPPQLTAPPTRPGAPVPGGAWPPSVNGVSLVGSSSALHDGVSSVPPGSVGLQAPPTFGRPPGPVSFQGPPASGMAGIVRPSPSPVGGPQFQVYSYKLGIKKNYVKLV